MKIAFRGIALTILLIIGGACGKDSPVLSKNPTALTRTFESLRKVDDHPLYTMRFYAHYGFDNRLKNHTRLQVPSSSDDPHETRWACTCIAAIASDADALMGRNFDWLDHPALLLFTDPPDGYASVSMVDIAYLGYDRQSNPANDPQALRQAPYMPFDGMNETGLAIGMMAVSQAWRNRLPNAVTLTSLEVIRLVLDYAGTVDEAINLMGSVNIDFSGGPPLHYLVADASGHSALIEFCGELIVSRGQPWLVATNLMMANYTIPEAREACWRYNLAYGTLSSNEGALTNQGAMQLLNDVSQHITQWSLVYNLTTGSVRVVMGKKYDRILTFTLD